MKAMSKTILEIPTKLTEALRVPPDGQRIKDEGIKEQL